MIWNRSVIFTDAHIRRATACRSWMPYGGRTRIRPHQTIPFDESTARSLLTRRNRNFSPCARLHVFNRPVADTPSHESQGRMTDGCRHPAHLTVRSEEHTSELQSLMRTSYADFCLKT